MTEPPDIPAVSTASSPVGDAETATVGEKV